MPITKTRVYLLGYWPHAALTSLVLHAANAARSCRPSSLALSLLPPHPHSRSSTASRHPTSGASPSRRRHHSSRLGRIASPHSPTVTSHHHRLATPARRFTNESADDIEGHTKPRRAHTSALATKRAHDSTAKILISFSKDNAKTRKRSRPRHLVSGPSSRGEGGLATHRRDSLEVEEG